MPDDPKPAPDAPHQEIDLEIMCSGCGEDWILTVDESRKCRENGKRPPGRCPSCRGSSGD